MAEHAHTTPLDTRRAAARRRFAISRCQLRAPVPTVRIMDLHGIGADGNLYLWTAAARVQPMSRFPRTTHGIVSGHYIILRGRAAVTVHCSNASKGWIVVQYMCGGAPTVTLPVKPLADALLGMVIPDPGESALITAALQRLTQDAVARQTAPHRRRGAA